MKKLKRIMILGLCGAVLATASPYRFTNNHQKIYAANDTFTVTPKEDAEFFVNHNVQISQFNFSLNGNTINTDNIKISPPVFTTTGTNELTITYDTETAVYQQKINIEVKDVLAHHLELASGHITLVKNQAITVETLPDVYLCYNDGTKKVLTDYTTEIDWDKGILTISSNGFTIIQNVTVIDSELSYIKIFAKKSVVPADYEFTKDDFIVTAYFTNGTNMVVTDYQIQPYTLVDGGETVITIKYGSVTGSFVVTGTAPSKTATPNSNITENFPEETSSSGTTINTPTITQPPSNTDTNGPDTKEAATITLGKASITQGIGEKVKVNIKTANKVAVSMHSKNQKVAFVTKSGYIKGIGKGSTKIVVTAGSSQAMIRVKVYPAPSKIGVTSKLASSTSYVLKKGATRQIPIYFNKGSYSNKITFKSSKKSIASVTTEGKVTAKKAGRAVIRICSFNQKKASVKVTVVK